MEPQQSSSTSVSQGVPSPNQEATQPPQGELDRVRELILGSADTPGQTTPTMRKTEVDRLREILFGTQMQEYQRHFADMRREIERVSNDFRSMRDRVNEFEKNQTKRIEDLERQARQSNEETQREIDRLRGQETMVQQLLSQQRQQEMLAQGLSKNSTEINNALTQHTRDIRSLRSNISEQRDQYERKLDTIKQELRQAEDSLWAEIRRAADQLGDQKTDRKALASMLMEVATRLETGSTVTGLLEGLATPLQD